jgi:putative polyhydroxyalkanoate system protein
VGQTVSLSIPHALGRDEARRRIEVGFGRLEQQLRAGRIARVERQWQGDRLTFRAAALGQSIDGRLDVLDDIVRMEIDLPPFLAAIAGRIKGRLQKEAQLLLEKK